MSAAKRVHTGVFLSTRLAGAGGSDDPLPFVAQAALAESAGFDSIWAGDSLVARPRLEPLTLLTALAMQTKRITLGTAVLLPALRHPLIAAHAIASLDRLAQGRLVLGVGSGFRYPGTERELGLVGVPMSERVARVTESIEIWRKLWSAEGPVSHRGRAWSFDDVTIVPRPSRAGGPPIWMGGNAPAAERRAALLADGFFPTSATPAVFRQSWQRVQESAAGRSLVPAVVLTLNAGRDAGVARDELRAYMEGYYGAPLEMLATFIGCHAGEARSCADWILEYVAAGAEHVVLRFAGADQLALLERVAADVLPEIARA